MIQSLPNSSTPPIYLHDHPGPASLSHSDTALLPSLQTCASGPLHSLRFLPGTLRPLPRRRQSVLTGPTPHSALNSNLTPRWTSSLRPHLSPCPHPATLHCNLCFIFLPSSLPGSSLLDSVTLDCQPREAGAADCRLADRGMHKALSGCVSEEDPGECPGPLLPRGGRVHVPGQPRAQAAGEKEWAHHTQAPGSACPEPQPVFGRGHLWGALSG